MDDVALIVLAGGGSSRMGQAKQLLPVAGQPLIRRTVARALASRCRPVLVVTGASRRPVGKAIADLPVILVENRLWWRGIGSSIHAGVREAARRGAGAAIVTLGDQPMLSAACWNRLVDEWDSRRCPVVASTYSGTIGAPVLFARSLFPSLLETPEETGCKALIAMQPPEGVALCPCPEAAVDLDTPDDYRHWQAGFA